MILPPWRSQLEYLKADVLLIVQRGRLLCQQRLQFIHCIAKFFPVSMPAAFWTSSNCARACVKSVGDSSTSDVALGVAG